MASAIALISGSAMAQWLWIDEAGNKVFSDTAPPPGTPEKNILRKAGPQAAPRLTEAAAVPVTPVPVAKPGGKDDQLEAKKKQADEAAKAKKKAEAEQFARVRAENCERAKRAKATLDSGVRVATTNAKGEREIMDDKARSAEVQRIDGIIRSDCGPAAQGGTIN